MNRRHFLTALISSAIFAGVPAHAATFEDSVVAQLKAQGYKSIAVERTLLGRVKIVAQLNEGQREIILNPRTGEVLRDFWTAKAGGPSVPKIRDQSDQGGNSGNGNDDDEDEDEDDDESGGDNSGGHDEDGGHDNSGDEGDSDE